MRIGVTIGMQPMALDAVIERAREVADAGLHDVWMPNMFSLDAVATLGLVGREVPGLGLGTAVTPTYPRHPSALAQQALTTAAMADNRFTLGIGLSHKIVIEDMLGLSYARPAGHMRDYLEALMPLVRGEQANLDNDHFRLHGVSVSVPGGDPLPVYVAALGPRMLEIAGSMADGTILWMVGPKTISEHIGPGIRNAADTAGRPAPQIVAGFPVAVVDDVAAARQAIGETLTIYGQLPSYRAMLDREGVEGPADLAIVGTAAEVHEALDDLAGRGVTHFNASIMPVEPHADARTLEALADYVAS